MLYSLTYTFIFIFNVYHTVTYYVPIYFCIVCNFFPTNQTTPVCCCYLYCLVVVTFTVLLLLPLLSCCCYHYCLVVVTFTVLLLLPLLSSLIIWLAEMLTTKPSVVFHNLYTHQPLQVHLYFIQVKAPHISFWTQPCFL